MVGMATDVTKKLAWSSESFTCTPAEYFVLRKNDELPFDSHTNGVGIEIKTTRKNGHAKLVLYALQKAMAQYGCHPNATIRIYNRLKLGGVSRSTVRGNLNFVQLEKDLKAFDLVLTMIAPQTENLNTSDGEWPKEFLYGDT